MISAIVVAYYPNKIFLDNIHRLSAQVEEIIVVDNGSQGQSAQWVESAGKLSGVRLVCNGSNLGIATALNIGIRRALQSGRPWIATFDQDSAIPESYFKQLFQAYNLCPMALKAGMIVPGGWGIPNTRIKEIQPASPAWSFVPGAVSSGSVIKAEIFQSVGYFDDTLFIDYVDTDFCLRLRKSGYKILSASAAFLEHELGERQTRRFLGFQISFRIHAAWRYYYIVRNRLLLYRRYWKFATLWALQDAGQLMLELGRIACLEQGRSAKLHAVFQGVKDALRGKTGRHPDFP